MADRILHQFDASTAMFSSTKGPSGVLELLLSRNWVDGSKSVPGCLTPVDSLPSRSPFHSASLEIAFQSLSTSARA
jgi:hypothetical protein